MQLDLKNLSITREELQNLTGMSQRDWKAYESLKYPNLGKTLIFIGYLEQTLFLGYGLVSISYLIKWKHFRKKLRRLLSEVDRYNDLVKLIDLGDKLEAAGNQRASIENREKAIAVLQIVRDNLISAIKTEKILRENRALLERNLNLLNYDISSLQALQINTEASEYGRLLNDAVQLSIDVQTEMKKEVSSEW